MFLAKVRGTLVDVRCRVREELYRAHVMTDVVPLALLRRILRPVHGTCTQPQRNSNVV